MAPDETPLKHDESGKAMKPSNAMAHPPNDGDTRASDRSQASAVKADDDLQPVQDDRAPSHGAIISDSPAWILPNSGNLDPFGQPSHQAETVPVSAATPSLAPPSEPSLTTESPTNTSPVKADTSLDGDSSHPPADASSDRAGSTGETPDTAVSGAVTSLGDGSYDGSTVYDGSSVRNVSHDDAGARVADHATTEHVPVHALPTSQTVAPRLRPPYSLILSRVQMELQETPVFAPPPHSLFVQRIEGWKPIAAPRPLSGSVAQLNCALCGATKETHSLIWHAYGVDKDIAGSVRAAQDAGLVGVTPDLVKRHFPNHNYEQPAPVRRYRNQELASMGEDLKEREKKMLLAVYRQRVLLSRQLADLFFAPETRNDTSAKKSSYRFLHELRFRHFLYQYRNRSRRSPEVYYFLGRYGAPWIEQQEGRLVGSPYTTSHADISEYMLEHDVRAADVFVKLRKQLYTNRDKDNLITVGAESLPLYMSTREWHGARSLGFIYHDPLANAERRIIPDGFATLTVNGADVRSQLPFFYEWDSGTKMLDETLGQLVNYVGFALSGVIGQRFPQLDIPHYFPPVLWVTSTVGRSYKLAQAARAALSRFGADSVPTILVTDVETLSEQGFASGAWHVVHPSDASGNLAELLVQGNRPLINRGNLAPNIPLAVDPDAARPKR